MYDDDRYWEFHDRLTWESIKPHLPRIAPANCCDLGCGTGKWGLKLLKSGFAVTFVDHSAAMIARTQEKLPEGPRGQRATLLVADIVRMPDLLDSSFDLVLAMGDPLSICSDPAAAAREMLRITKPGGFVIATADNKLAALDYYLQKGELGELAKFVATSRTHWLTAAKQEQFELTTFTPGDFRGLMEKTGFETVRLMGKTILPIRLYKDLLNEEGVMQQLLDLEMDLARDSSAAARAAHLQIIARRPVAT